MPPRQKTTFNKKGKGTTTYKEYNPAQERASSQLERFIRDNPAGDDRNTAQSSVQQVIADMPQKFKDRTFKDFTGIDYNDMTQGQKMIFDFYNNRNKYQRDMNNLRTSSPEMRQAYATKFPVSNFAMEMGPTIAGAMVGLPLGALERGFDATKKGFDFAKSGAGQGLDSLVSGIDKGMGAVESGLDFLTGKASGAKDDAIDIFQDAIAKREEPSTFTVQNRPGGGANDSPLANFGNFRDDFDSFLTDVSQQDVEKLDPLANQKLSDPQFYGGRSRTDEMFPRNFTIIEDDPAGLGRQYNQMLKDNQLNFNTQNQIDPNNQFNVAELTQKQIDFMRNPMQSLDFQSRDSLFNKVKQLEDKGFLGFGAQEPTTREEFEQFINLGGIQQAANGGMMEKGIASLNSPEYQRLMSASNFGF